MAIEMSVYEHFIVSIYISAYYNINQVHTAINLVNMIRINTSIKQNGFVIVCYKLYRSDSDS